MSAAVLTYCTKAAEMGPGALCLEDAFDFLPWKAPVVGRCPS